MQRDRLCLVHRRPQEAHRLARHRDGGDLRRPAGSDSMEEPMEAVLGFPRMRDERGRLPALAAGEERALARGTSAIQIFFQGGIPKTIFRQRPQRPIRTLHVAAREKAATDSVKPTLAPNPHAPTRPNRVTIAPRSTGGWYPSMVLVPAVA